MSRSVSSRTLIRRERPPRIVTWPTPFTDSIWRRNTLSANSVVSRSVRFPESATERIGVASGSSFSTMGWSMSRGRSASTRLTLSRTSCAATSTFFSRMNVTKTCEMPSADTDCRSSMPAIVLIGLLDLVRDLGLDLFGRGAREARDDGHRREVDARVPVDAEARVADSADDDERDDEDGREDGTADAEARECLHGGLLSGRRRFRCGGLRARPRACDRGSRRRVRRPRRPSGPPRRRRSDRPARRSVR